jgi:microcompartment protein CcmL/EutN
MKSLGLIETKGLLPAIECADVMLKSAEVHLLDRTYVGGGLVTVTVAGDVSAVQTAVDAAKAALERLDSSALRSSHVIPRPDVEVIDNLFTPPPTGGNEEPEPPVDPIGSDVPESEVVQQPIAETVSREKTEESEIVESDADKSESDTADVVEQEEAEVDSTVEATQEITEPETKEEPTNSSKVSEKQELEPTVSEPVVAPVEQMPLVSEPEKKVVPVKTKNATMSKSNVDALWEEQGAEGVIGALTKLTLAKLKVLAREYADLPIESKKLSKVKKRTLVEVFKRYYASLNK